MLSQCKDANRHPAARFANEAARIERFGRLPCELCELKNLNFGGYSCRVNQSGACSSSDVIMSGGCMWIPGPVR